MKTRFYILIGAAIGLIAGLGVAFLLFSSTNPGMPIYSVFYVYLAVTLVVLFLSVMGIRTSSASPEGGKSRTRSIAIFAVVAIACLASSFMILRQMDRHELASVHEQQLLAKQDAMIEAQEKEV